VVDQYLAQTCSSIHMRSQKQFSRMPLYRLFLRECLGMWTFLLDVKDEWHSSQIESFKCRFPSSCFTPSLASITLSRTECPYLNVSVDPTCCIIYGLVTWRLSRLSGKCVQSSQMVKVCILAFVLSQAHTVHTEGGHHTVASQ